MAEPPSEAASAEDTPRVGAVPGGGVAGRRARRAPRRCLRPAPRARCRARRARPGKRASLGTPPPHGVAGMASACGGTRGCRTRGRVPVAASRGGRHDRAPIPTPCRPCPIRPPVPRRPRRGRPGTRAGAGAAAPGPNRCRRRIRCPSRPDPTPVPEPEPAPGPSAAAEPTTAVRPGAHGDGPCPGAGVSGPPPLRTRAGWAGREGPRVPLGAAPYGPSRSRAEGPLEEAAPPAPSALVTSSRPPIAWRPLTCIGGTTHGSTGRHRRHQPSRLLGRLNRASLTVTVGGRHRAALIGAGTAQAASVDVWEKVAACESTSRWKINSERVLRRTAVQPVHVGSATEGPATRPAPTSRPRTSRSRSPRRCSRARAPVRGSTCSTRADSPCGGEAPRHRAGPEGRLRSHEGHLAHPRAQPAPRELHGGPRDSSRIAQARRVPGGWQRLYEQNRDVIGDDPDLILPGQKLTLTGKGRAAAPKAPSAPRAGSAGAKAKGSPCREGPAEGQARGEARGAAKARLGDPAHRARRRVPQELRWPPRRGPPRAAYGTRGSAWSAGYHTGVDFPCPRAPR